MASSNSDTGSGGGKSSNVHGSSRWSGSSVESLQAWLEAGGVDTTLYGTGEAKTLQDLLQEVEKSETELVTEGGVPLRHTQVVGVIIKNHQGQTLVETKQVLEDGRERKRDTPLCEKLMGDEGWAKGAVRGVHEELGSILPLPLNESQVIMDTSTYRVSTRDVTSQSYPGLVTRYTFHSAEGSVPCIPQIGTFQTTETSEKGTKILHWSWRDDFKHWNSDLENVS